MKECSSTSENARDDDVSEITALNGVPGPVLAAPAVRNIWITAFRISHSSFTTLGESRLHASPQSASSGSVSFRCPLHTDAQLSLGLNVLPQWWNGVKQSCGNDIRKSMLFREVSTKCRGHSQSGRTRAVQEQNVLLSSFQSRAELRFGGPSLQFYTIWRTWSPSRERPLWGFR